MIKKILVTLTVLMNLSACQSFKGSTQKSDNFVNYFLKVYKADSLYIIKDYTASFAILDSLFKVYKPLNLEKYKEYETYISCAFAINKPMNFKSEFLKSIALYGTNVTYIKNDSILNLAYRFSKISHDEASASTQKYRNSLNLALRDSIKQICEDDQLFRKRGTAYSSATRDVDSLNEIKLRLIIDKYGYPHEKLIGEFYIDSTDVNLASVLLHTKADFSMNYLLPKILIAVQNGKAYPESYSETYDRQLSLIGDQKQLYGSYGSNYQLKNPQKLDSLRKSIGLPNINYAKWRRMTKYGLDW